jgi:O-acetyl-ADP-ribose deacetylase (regulator of RNase III)
MTFSKTGANSAPRWTIRAGNILDEPAEVLVCSANPYLNLSGGVGGAYLLRYGEGMQRELHAWLARNNLRCVPRGEVVEAPPCGGPYRTVLHAVGVDAFYDTSSEVIASVVGKSLETAARLGASKVALAAIGTGYGRLSLTEFAQGVRPLVDRSFRPLAEVAICLRKDDDARRLRELLGTRQVQDDRDDAEGQ